MYLPSIFFSKRAYWSVIPLFVAQLALSWILTAFVGQVSWRPRINRALRDLGYDVCVKCGYWLRGLHDDTEHCPECGTRREIPRPSSRR